MKKLLPFLVIIFALPHAGCGQAPSWSMIQKTIRATYPDVRHLSTDSLAALLERPASAPLLLDVRTEDEYAVSHLPGARRIDPDAPDLAPLQALPPDTPIVTYCSVGYRSAALAERLGEAGFTHVANLEGSIFAWANEGRPVYRAGSVVRQVHPYDALWGRLLNKDLHAYTASPER